MRRTLLILIHGYQWVSRGLLPASCRYWPSCSEYAATAIHRHGPGRGLWLAVGRLLRCHPLAPGGVDFVPERSR